MPGQASERSKLLPPIGDSPTRGTKLWHPAYIILITAMFERIGSMGVRANLVQFLEYHGFLEWSTTEATMATLMATNFAQLLAVGAGYLADSYFGRFTVTMLAIISQFAGAMLLMGAAILEKQVLDDDQHVDTFRGLVITGLVLFGIGFGSASGTEIPLGIDQYEEAEQLEANKFFPLYYWFVNIGSVIGLSGISVVQVNWHVLGYALPPAAILLSAALLFACRGQLTKKEPAHEQRISLVWKVCLEARRVQKQKKRKRKEQTASHGFEPPTPHDSPWETDVTAPWMKYAEVAFGGRYSRNEVINSHNFIAVVSIVASTIFYQVIIAQVRFQATKEPRFNLYSNNNVQATRSIVTADRLMVVILYSSCMGIHSILNSYCMMHHYVILPSLQCLASMKLTGHFCQ